MSFPAWLSSLKQPSRRPIRKAPLRRPRLLVDRLEDRLLLAGDFGFAAGFSSAGGANSGNAVATDAAGNVYTTGAFQGTVDFDPGAGTSNLTSAGTNDIFISKLNSAGNFVWARQLGGTLDDQGNGITVDSSGNVLTTGYFRGTVDFDPGAGTSNLTSAGGDDIFVSKLDSAGNFVWARRLGGTGGTSFDRGQGIAVDASGNVLTTGPFSGTADFDPGAGTSNLTSAGSNDIFVSKLNSAGNFVWAGRLGGTSADAGFGIAVDGSGNVVTTGQFLGTADFDPGAGTSNLTSAGSGDIFVSKLNSAGTFVWAGRLGGTGNDFGQGIAVDASGNVLTTGSFNGTADFDPGAGTSNLTSAGSSDIFVSKLNSAGAFVWARQLGGGSVDQGVGIAVSASGNVLTTGSFNGTADFDPGAGTSNLTSAGADDIFVSKLNSAGTFVWARQLGGTSNDQGRGIAVHASANVYTTGFFQGTADFDPGAGTYNLTSLGTSGAFVSMLTDNTPPIAPVDNNPAPNSVTEGASNGALVGITANSTDPDIGQTVTYSLTNSAGGRFAINSSSGVVAVADGSLLNYETTSSHLITVQASDGFGGTSSQSFTIAVTNVNPSTPTDANAAANSVAEGAANGATVAVTASSTDPNGPAVTFSLTDSAGGRFAIHSSSGVVTVADGTLLNYETATSHQITVQASDGAGGTSSQSFTIAVTNVNPSTPTDANAAANSVAEGAANGATVAVTASSTDPNGPAVTFSLTDSAGGRFAIHSSSGVVTVADGTLLNYETATSHQITVQASDGAGGTSSQSFTIAVTNVNPTAPTDANAAANSVAEGAANGASVAVTASSTDPNGPAVTFSLTDSAGGRFAVHSSSGVVTVADGTLLNYETATSHQITVQASDGTGGTSSQSFTIAVTNVNPSTPTDADAAANSVAEGAANGASVAVTASSTDPNGPAVTFSLTDSAGGRFAIHSSSGVVTVADGTLLDYETTSSHLITVQASDGAGGTSSQSFTIAVTNVNPSTPTDADAAANSVAEGAANGATVAVTASSTDPNGPAVTFSLTDSAGGRFAIHSSSGVVTVADGTLLNYETATSHQITVQASDGAGGTSSQSFTIAVTNVNPTMPTDADAAANSVAEGAANGATVAVTASSTDPNGPAVTFSLTDTAGGRFAIHSSNGVVTVADGSLLDYETATSHQITVLASDGAGGTSSQSFTIAVTNVNPSTPTDADAAANSLAEGAANGATVAVTASSTDPNGPAVTFSLTDSAGGRFAIHSSSGVVTVADGSLLDYETATNHNITVQASDGFGGTSSQSFTIAVTNVNPTTPTDANAAANSVAEGAANGSTVGLTASSTDPNGPAVTFSLTDSAGGRFAIHSGSGVVTVANSALLDGPVPHSITVQASDGAGGTSTQSFSIAVTNVAPTVTAAANQSAKVSMSTAFQLGSFTDPGPDSPWTVDVDWGDSTSPTTFNATATGSLGSQTHTYALPGSYTVTVKVTDKDGDFDSESFTVTVSYFTFGVGSTGADLGNAVATDTAGNVYVTGSFAGTVDFDPGTGTANLTSAGGSDIFVAKYSPTAGLLWAAQMGGSLDDMGLGLVVDGAGHVYTTGTFRGTADFDPGVGTANLVSAGNTDIFVSRLDSAGNFVWAGRLGGNAADTGTAVALDSGGNVLTTGTFSRVADFDPGAGTANLRSAGVTDVFVSKLDGAGAFVWAKRMGGGGIEHFDPLRGGIAVDATGAVYTTGAFTGPADFDPSPGTFNLVSAGVTDVFVSKLDSAGNFVWARRMGGIGADGGTGIALDGAGNVHTTGLFSDTADFDPGVGTANLVSAGGNDVFVSKLDGAGIFVWARRMGGPGLDTGSGIALDGTGAVYTTGFFAGTADFDPGAGTANLTSAGNRDVFVSKLDSAGNFVWAKGMGGLSLDAGNGITVDSAGAIYTTGQFSGTADFDPDAGIFNLTSAGGTDVFVMKLSQSGGGLALHAPRRAVVGGTHTVTLTSEMLRPIVAEAIARWSAAGVDPEGLKALAQITFEITNLPYSHLGLTFPYVIQIDVDAAGFGWFIDSTPDEDSEFPARPASPAYRKMDLLTVVAHELGHVLGFAHSHAADDVMSETLAVGVRHMTGCGCPTCLASSPPSNVEPTLMAGLTAFDVVNTDLGVIALQNRSPSQRQADAEDYARWEWLLEDPLAELTMMGIRDPETSERDFGSRAVNRDDESLHALWSFPRAY